MADERAILPPDLADGFEQALANYHDWRPGEPEPTVSFDQRAVGIGMVCQLVMNFRGSMPAGLAVLLAKEQHGGVAAFNLEAINTYANGARFLLELINYRANRYHCLKERG